MNALRQHIANLINEKSLERPHLAQQSKLITIKRLLTSNLLVFLMQYIGLMLSTLNNPITSLWLASGTACAFVFLRGYSILLGVGLGTFFGYYFANIGLLSAVIYAILLPLQVYLIFTLSCRYISPSLIFYQKKLFIKFVVLCMSITAIISYLLLKTTYSKLNSDFTLLQLWLQWWLANYNGLIIFAFAIITWDAYFPQIYLLKNQFIILAKLFGPMIFLCALLYLEQDILIHHTAFLMLFAFLLLTLTLYISMQLKWCGIITALLIQGLFLNGIGFFNSPLFAGNFTDSLFLQLFIWLEIFFGLWVIFIPASRSISYSSLKLG